MTFSRHAGPADTVLIADQLLSSFNRHPSVVFKEAVAIDPCIDLLAHRLPHAVLDTTDRNECESRITAVTEQGERHESDVLIGADGIRSTVRDLMGAPESLCFSGEMAYRALIPGGLICCAC